MASAVGGDGNFSYNQVVRTGESEAVPTATIQRGAGLSWPRSRGSGLEHFIMTWSSIGVLILAAVVVFLLVARGGG